MLGGIFTRFSTLVFAVFVLFAAQDAAAAELVKIKFILNWKYEGPHGYFFIAQDKGWFKEQGIEVTFDQGAGSAAAVIRIAGGAYDAGFGDLNSLIQFKAENPNNDMKAVQMHFYRPPFVIVSLKEKNITKPKDLEGKKVGVYAIDATFKLFPGFADITGIDKSKIEWQYIDPKLREQLLVRGQLDAITAYYLTAKFGFKAMGFDPDKANYMFFSDHGMDLYSNAIIFSGEILEKHPDAVKGFLHALNRGFMYMLEHPQESVEAVRKREPLLKYDLEREKWDETLEWMILHPELKDIGFGAVLPDRLKRSIDTVAKSFGLARTPAAADIFDDRFLPAKAERMFKTWPVKVGGK